MFFKKKIKCFYKLLQADDHKLLLLFFILLQADPTGPEFNSSFKQTELASLLSCSGFNIYLQDQTMIHLLNIYEKLSSR